jgi:inner membrane protein
MATIMAHALAAGSFYKLLSSKKDRMTLRFCLLGSILPDADVLGFSFGIAYQDMLGHRGFTHSILFGLLYAIFCIAFYLKEDIKTKLKLFSLFFISIMSHGILDMLTNGGYGVGLFIPFSPNRYFFPITPLEVSPIGRNFMSQRGIDVLLNESYYIGIPSMIILLIVFLIQRKFRN